MDESDFLNRILAVLKEAGIRYCVIGGQAVNAYVEPLVSLDLDLVVATDQLGDLEGHLAPPFQVQRHAHSLNASAPGSDLRVQFQTDPRYSAFYERAQMRTVLGVDLPVACLEDVLQGKVWAVQDPSRRPSKRQKDLADIARLLELRPDLRGHVPEPVQAQLLQ